MSDDLPIIVYEANSAHEAIREVTDKEFSVIAAPHKTVYMEIVKDRVFIYPLKMVNVLQQMFLLLISAVLITLTLLNIIQFTDYLFFQITVILGYLIFVAPRANYDRVLVPLNYTNYYRNQLRDDPESKVRTIRYDAVIVDWAGYHRTPTTRQVVQLSSKVGSRVQGNFQNELKNHLHTSPPEPKFDDIAFLESQKEQSDLYNIKQKPE